MANPTTNFGWVMPTSTDLVTDLPADFAVFGQGVDTTMADLKGGTTGQILAKATSTDMDFTWVTNDVGDITAVTAGTGISGGGTSGAVTITNDMATTITAAGDIVVGTGSGTYDNLPIGTTGQVLTADTTVSPYKVKWATAAGGSTFSGVGVSNTTDLSTSTGTWTSITFNTELFDTDAYHSTATNTSRITIPAGKSGYFLVTIVGLFEGTNATGTRDLAIAKNGTRVLESVTNKATGSNQSCAASIVMSLVATDYIEFQVRQSSGTTVPWYGTGSSGGTSYTVTYLGA